MPSKNPDPNPQSFLAMLEHPQKEGMLLLREIFLSASPGIQEGIKWNSLSFRTTEWFATLNCRAPDQVQFVMHLGARAKEQTGVSNIGDGNGLLKWLGKDRALLTL